MKMVWSIKVTIADVNQSNGVSTFVDTVVLPKKINLESGFV
jgi:uncharacterized surface protein with fasciclin (FAS1) repeats